MAPVNPLRNVVFGVVCLSTQAVALPDLTVTAVNAPAVADTGQSINVTTDIENIGTTRASNYRLGLYLSPDTNITTGDVFLATETLGLISVGETIQTTNLFTIPVGTAPGTYYIGAIADWNESIAESDETNNALASGAIEISIGPDLTVTAVNTPVLAGANEYIRVRTYIENIGTGWSLGYSLHLYLSPDTDITGGDLLLDISSQSAIASGATVIRDRFVTIPGGTTPGIYYIGAIVDRDNSIPESDETNNAMASGTIDIYPDDGPVIRSINVDSGMVNLLITGLREELIYQVQSSSNLMAEPGWSDVGEQITGNFWLEWSETKPDGVTKRFYRIIEVSE